MRRIVQTSGRTVGVFEMRSSQVLMLAESAAGNLRTAMNIVEAQAAAIPAEGRGQAFGMFQTLAIANARLGNLGRLALVDSLRLREEAGARRAPHMLVPEQRDRPASLERLRGFLVAHHRIDPVEGGRRDQQVERASRDRPILERADLHVYQWIGSQVVLRDRREALEAHIAKAQAFLTTIRAAAPSYRFDDFIAAFRFTPDAAARFKKSARRIGFH